MLRLLQRLYPLRKVFEWNPELPWAHWRTDNMLFLPGIEQVYLANHSELDTLSYELILKNDRYYRVPKY